MGGLDKEGYNINAGIYINIDKPSESRYHRDDINEWMEVSDSKKTKVTCSLTHSLTEYRSSPSTKC